VPRDPNKVDGQCYAPGCEEKIDWHKWDKPPPNWGHITYIRYGKKGVSGQENFLVCPVHTINFARRQMVMPSLAPKKFRRVIIETPPVLGQEVQERYILAAMRDALLRGDSPHPSRWLYTMPGALSPRNVDERKMAIDADNAWTEVIDACVLYDDLGIVADMERGAKAVEGMGKPIERRKVAGWKG
jgi:hypothetical protein